LHTGCGEASNFNGTDFSCEGGWNCEKASEGKAVDELRPLVEFPVDIFLFLTFPAISIPGCPANICMKTAPILMIQPIPNVFLFPILSARYPEPMAPKKPPIDDAVLNAICQLALTMY
jgi:hypothetical protein